MMTENTEPTDDLRAELGRETNKKASWQVSTLLFLVFIALGLAGRSVESIAILVGVLLFHEAGHALGMLVFGYRDVQIFFLPFFGAAVTGRKPDAPAWQRTVILLLGPLPGICVGIALLLVSRGAGIAGEIGRMAVYINVFNLLPFEPLDGGRVLGVTLFARWRWLEAAFGALGAIALFAIGVKLGAWLLGLLGAFSLFGVRRRFRIAEAAKRIVDRGLPVDAPVDAVAPETLAALDNEARAFLAPVEASLPQRAALVREIHLRARAAPPGPLATVGLLFAYGFGWVLSIVAVGIIAYLSEPPADVPNPADGEMGNVGAFEHSSR
ncbi:MAG: hypothetical protein IPK82_30175 [Polyangiaceae bacterium]|nr:hypothetical protein [Polyangiaceae bacterium]